jgi:hypothetical protein
LRNNEREIVLRERDSIEEERERERRNVDIKRKKYNKQ